MSDLNAPEPLNRRQEQSQPLSPQTQNLNRGEIPDIFSDLLEPILDAADALMSAVAENMVAIDETVKDDVLPNIVEVTSANLPELLKGVSDASARVEVDSDAISSAADAAGNIAAEGLSAIIDGASNLSN